MFGLKMYKMYKKGVADALAANRDYMEKQLAAIEHVREEIKQGRDIDEAMLELLKKDLGNLYQYLTTQERRRLYNLATPFDIQEIDDQQKELLVAVLIQLAEDEGSELTDYQRKYVSSVQQYLQVTQPATSAELKAVGNIDSLAIQQAFLQVALEFFYLQDGDELSEPQMEFLSYFSINERQWKLINRNVSRLYNALGPEGLALHYGPIPEDEEGPAESWAERLEKQLPDPAKMEGLILSQHTIVSEGEELVYKDRLIDFTKFKPSIDCGGSLTFDHCILRYDKESGQERINIKNNGSLRLHNCRIEGSLYEKNPGPESFITVRTDRTSVVIDACSFTNTSAFLFLGSCGAVLRKSILTDPGADFIEQGINGILGLKHAFHEKIVITDCVFSLPNWFIQDKCDSHFRNVISCGNFELARCSVRGNPAMLPEKDGESTEKRLGSDIFLRAAKGSVTHCSFFDMYNIFATASMEKDSLTVNLSRFDHCASIFWGGMFSDGVIDMSDCLIERSAYVAIGLNQESRITACQFNDCFGTLISTPGLSSKGGLTVDSCTFNNWKGRKEKGCSLMDFSFSKDAQASEVKKCEFNGIQAYGGHIISASLLYSSDSYAVSVSDCRFNNCRTDGAGGSLIKAKDYYYGAFKRKMERLLVREDRNIGLEKVNQDSDHNDNIKRMEYSAADERIGADIELELVI